MSAFQVDLKGRAAIVTGAGIGRTIAVDLARAGAAVAINDINPDRSYQVAQEINRLGGPALDWQADVSNRFQVAALIEAARDAFGRIDILINAAGALKTGSMLKLDEWDWRRLVDVNLTGAFFCSQLLGRVMAEEGGGVIVNLASTAGHPNTLQEGIGYVATQAGIIGLTRQCARELGPFGIRVNAVCPANISNGSTGKPSSANALGRLGARDEVAAVVLFLCSDAASFITGQAINVDGGESMV